MSSSMLRVFAFVLLAVAVFASPKSTTEVIYESVLLFVGGSRRHTARASRFRSLHALR